MPCFSTLQAWRGRKLPNGKRSIVFKKSLRDESLVDSELRLPCGHCVGCYLERSRQWAMRCVAEASMHERNCFITLTYNDSHLPQDGSLCLRDYQLFMKKLRKHAGNCKVRFFMCGEYGELNSRPHFHACLFNWDFADKVLWSVRRGVRLYRSPRLEKLWGKGFATVGDVTFESAAYVARYVLKKVSGGVVVDGDRIDPNTGVCLRKEFVTMSRGKEGGIGKKWFDKFKNDLYPSDYYIVRGHKCRPARFYDLKYEGEFPKEMAEIRARRMSRARRVADDNDVFRSAVKEACCKSRIKTLKRTLEGGYNEN